MLFKNTFKLFKQKKFQFLAIGIIIFLSSFLYTAMNTALGSLEKSISDYFYNYNQEDFSVDTINNLTETELSMVLTKYSDFNPLSTLSDVKSIDLELFDDIIKQREEAFLKEYPSYILETRQAKDILFTFDETPIKMRVLKDNSKVNLTYIEEGRKPQNNNEIAVTRVFADSHNLSLGDSININDKVYNISGFFLVPDYTLGIFDKEFILDAGAITVGLFTDNEYANLKGKESFKIGGLSRDEFDEKDFKENVVKDYMSNNNLKFITSIQNTKSNLASGMIFEEVRTGKIATVGLSIMVASIALLIVAIIVYKIINNEKGQIGVLRAMGYLKKEIVKPYISIIIIISLPMLILGYIVGLLCGEPLIDFYLIYYLLPKEPIHIDYSIIFIAVLLPLIFFVGFSYLIINKLLNKKTLDLLKIGEDYKINALTKIMDKLLSKAKTTTKFKYSFILRNPGKFVVFLIGIIFSSSLVIIGLMMPGFYSKMSTDMYNKVDYQYEGFIDLTKEIPTVKNGDEKFLTVNNIDYQDKEISLIGLDSDNMLYNLFNKKNENITNKLKDYNIVINKSFKMFFDAKIGDDIHLVINNKEYLFNIDDISEEYGDPKVYIKREVLSNIVSDNKTDDMFNGVYSKEVLSKDQYSVVISKSDLIDQTESMKGVILLSVAGILGSAIFISVIVLYILTSLSVEDNYYNISLLKVMGYSKKEVNSMILNSYLGYSVIAFLISVPMTAIGVDLVVQNFTETYGMIFPLEFSLWQGIVAFIIVLVIFFIGTITAKKKISNISLQEVLKAYRE